jgi:hypothetical protein
LGGEAAGNDMPNGSTSNGSASGVCAPSGAPASDSEHPSGASADGASIGASASDARISGAPAGSAPGGRFASLGSSKTLFVCLGAATMVAGYFVAEATVLRLFDSGAFGWAAAVTELPVNLIQGCVSAILARIIAASLKMARLVP